MAKNILSQLVVQMTVESAQFQKELEKATAKQAAFEKKSKDSGKSLFDFEKTMGFATKAAAGFAAALAAVGLSQERQRNLENYAKLTGVTADKFLELSRAARTVGIEEEKLADISKDTLEKLGEFVATGGGGFKDFFDNVAPQVGVTAEQLQHLSGPEVLIAVQKAMDDANISMNEQSFYLESIASDTTALIPLLKEEGKAFEELGSKSETVGDALLNFKDVAVKVINDVDKVSGASNAFVSWLDRITTKIESVRSGKDSVESLKGDIESLRDTIENRRLKGLPTDDLQDQLFLLLDRLAFVKSEVSKTDIWEGLITPEATKRADDAASAQAEAFINSINARMEMADSPFVPLFEDPDLSIETLFDESVIEWPEIINTDVAKQEIAEVKQDLSSLSSYITNTMLSNLQIVTAGVGQMAGEASGFYKFLFALQKAAAIPSMITNTQEAYTKALTLDPTGVLAESVRISGYAAVGIAAGQAIAGVFHGGGAIPSGNHEQTYLLKGGEYVESRAERREIDKLVNAQSEPMNLNLSYNIQAMDSKGVKQVLLENNKTVYAAVQQAMRSQGKTL